MTTGNQVLISYIGILVAIIGLPITTKKLNAALETLKAEAATSNRCSSSKQCAFEETGNDPCGGPSGFVIYSTADTKSVRKIKRLASQTKSLQENINRQNRKKGALTMCVGLRRPELDCKNGKCLSKY
ncbi:unnamed protein product [Rotaria sp. Silwood1]|nr:unnamed protein product [Rotaria sp. Silwood1]